MLNPDDERIPQHRPTSVVVTDKAHASELAKSLLAIGVTCSVLSEAPGLATVVKAFSQHLVKRDIASTTQASNKPGACVHALSMRAQLL